MSDLNELPKNVYERLEYLEFMLRFRGWISRSDLVKRFDLSEPAATRDIRKYRDHAAKNMELNQKTKKYEIQEDTFQPLFECTIQSALSKVRTKKICEALGMGEFDGILCPPRLGYPKIEIVSAITRAIASNLPVMVTYRSIRNGLSDKQLIPHAIFDNGIHWYVRAFDPSKSAFRSYALTRIDYLAIDHTSDPKPEVKSKDHQWNRMVTLELVPHPNSKHVEFPETIMHDFDMEYGCLTVSVRATVAGYWLRHWNVDCTEDHSLRGYHYQLWLRNHQTLYDVESRPIAPGLSEYDEHN